ncbi:zf-HC2 domain-containing protein [Marinobacterium weihaiense]|nr:zf-HC2 domain-containing protein [Marinobacterium weihaiense]
MSQQLDRELSNTERFSLKAHLMMCRHCRHCDIHFKALHRFSETRAQANESEKD